MRNFTSAGPENVTPLALPDGWTYRPLDDLLRPGGLSYGIVQPGSDDPHGVPILRVSNLRHGSIVRNGALRVGPDVEQRYQRTRLSGNEVLLSVVGSIGEVAVVPANFIGWNVARAIAVIRAIETVSPQWLRLCLSSEPAQHFMHTWKTTTVQETLNLRDIRRLPILFPPTHERQAITTLLTALDDKIAANDRITETCDHLRSLSLQSWMQGNPAGSEERPLSSLAEFVNGRAFTKNASGTGRMVIRIAELNSGPALSTVYNDIAVPDQHLARPGDVLFAWSGSLTVTRWFRSEGIINQHIFKVLPTAGVPSWLIFELIRTKLIAFRGIAADKATTMGHIQRHHLDELVTFPTGDHVAKLDAQLQPLWRRALAAEQESLALAQLRDTLLPRLMSGEIRLRDAEVIIGDAT